MPHPSRAASEGQRRALLHFDRSVRFEALGARVFPRPEMVVHAENGALGRRENVGVVVEPVGSRLPEFVDLRIGHQSIVAVPPQMDDRVVMNMIVLSIVGAQLAAPSVLGHDAYAIAETGCDFDRVAPHLDVRAVLDQDLRSP